MADATPPTGRRPTPGTRDRTDKATRRRADDASHVAAPKPADSSPTGSSADASEPTAATGVRPAGSLDLGPRVRVVLASASPRRRHLLAERGIVAEVRAADVDERPRPDESAADLVVRLALAKAEAVVAGLDRETIVLAADTVVVLDGRTIGKPADEHDARATIRLLAGRSHDVLTGVAVGRGPARHTAVVRSTVTFHALTEAVIADYVATGEPLDKAGSYGIQGEGRHLVASVDGPIDNVIGLPLDVTIDLLRAALGADPT